MPRVIKDLNQPGVYIFEETEEEKQARLEKEDLELRIKAIEDHLASKSGYKVPAPKPGFVRKSV